MKKNLLLLAALFATASTAGAKSANEDARGSFAWAIGNESEATTTEAASSALLSSSVTVGTDLTFSTYDAASNGGGTLATYLPGTSNAGFVETDQIVYTITLKKGLTFTPESVQFDAVKHGTDAAYFSWSFACDDVAGDTIQYSDSKNQILRNNNSNSATVSLTHDKAISGSACRTFKLIFFINGTANNKKMSIGNIKINGLLGGTEEVRAFADFKINFRSNPFTVLAPESGLPEGVSANGTWHDAQHGYSNALVTVPVDGPVRFTVGGCGYSNRAVVKNAAGETLATLDTRSAGCDSQTSFDHFVVWTYNSETPEVLTFDLGNYCPFFYAEACELIPYRTVRYYDVDGTSIIGEETVEGGSALKFLFDASNVTVAEGYKFRGWFNSTQSSAVKVAEGTSVQDNLNLYAKATEIEVPTNISRYIYELNKANFYIEDHEAIWTEGGAFHDTQHGWSFAKGNTLSLAVAGKCIVSVGNCRYSAQGATATVTNGAGEIVATFPLQAETDGAETTFQYAGTQADVLTITFDGTAYVHKVSVYNVKDFVEYDESSGYYVVPANDANSFLIALASANATGNARIFLPNGTYDLGQLVLTTISGNNISIIGESMEGTVIVNAPLVENEGIGTTATLLNTSNGLYLQDLTLKNALDYYKSGAAGRAVCLQDKGQNTICKNVKMLSYQDTYYSNRASNFYWEDSEIHGTVDYLCGDGSVVYNRVALVNESRSASGNTGSDVIAAPYTTAGLWGYVFLDCTVRSESKDFTFARSWGGESKATFIRTRVLDNSLSASRWTASGMNVAAYAFKEYQTTDANGSVTTPASNVVNFTHSTGNRSYETVLTDEEAAQYTVANIYGEWAPDQTAAQAVIADDSDLKALADAYIVNIATTDELNVQELLPTRLTDALIPEILEQAELVGFDRIQTIQLRAANSRGGFGPVYEFYNKANAVNGKSGFAPLYTSYTGIETIETQATQAGPIFDLQGREINRPAAGQLYIQNGVKRVQK